MRQWRTFGRAAAASLVTAVSLAGPAPGADAADFRPFAADSVFNLPLRDDRAISPASHRHRGWLLWNLREYGFWLNSTSCGSPLYWAAPGTRRVRVALDHPSYRDPALVRAWSSVPIPADAAPAACPDKNFAVAQRQPDGTVRAWEFWNARRRADGGWVASWGGAMDDLRTDRGSASEHSWRDESAGEWLARRSTPGWNVTASSISMLAGVVRQAELRRGRIDHALALALNDTAKARWLWPAQRSDGNLTDPNALPEGAQLRLPADLDLSRYRMTPMVRMLASAAQRHGMVVRDRTGDANVICVEPPRRGRRDLASSLLAGQSPAVALRSFPWDKLEVLDAPSCTDWTGCVAAPSGRLSIDGAPRRRGDRVTADTSNSIFDQPREQVSWDLDGDGRFETPGGRQVKRSYRLTTAPPWRVGVRIVTRDGRVTVVRRRFEPR